MLYIDAMTRRQSYSLSWMFCDSHEISQADPRNHKILLTEPPLNPLSNREKLVQTMFEKYQFGAVNVPIQAMLTLYAPVLMTGVVVDTGDGVTHVVPVYDGFVPHNLITRLYLAVRHSTRYFITLFLLRGYSLHKTPDFY